MALAVLLSLSVVRWSVAQNSVETTAADFSVAADYEMNILPLAFVDEHAHVAMTAVPASRPIGKVKFVPVSAWVENVLEVLDQPGEWAVNTKERRIYLWPHGDQPGENADCILTAAGFDLIHYFTE